MSITITCEDCGRRHRLERQITEPGNLYIVCHNCELPLQAVLKNDTAGPSPALGPTTADPGVWSSILDLGSAPASA